MNNIIHQSEEDGNWYFFDESLTCKYGPFKSEKQALDAFYVYCEYLDTGMGKELRSSTDWNLLIVILCGLCIMAILVWIAI